MEGKPGEAGVRERLADWRAEIQRFSFQPARGHIDIAYWWAIPLLPVLLILAILIPYDVLYHLTYLWGLLLLVSWLWVRYQGPRVEIRRTLRTDWAQVGDQLEENWVLQNLGRLWVLWIEVSDGSTLPDYNARRVVATGPGGAEHWTTSALCRRRGRYRLGPLALEMSDPIGLFRYRRAEAGTREMIIYPPLVQLATLQRPRGQRGGVASAALLNILPTPNAGGLREYRPGDPLSFVHWRAVAHTGKMMVKEFDQEIAGAVWIVLDLARAVHSGTDDTATVEIAVVLACSLANLMLTEGRTVGLFTVGTQARMVRPGRGRQHVWEFMGTLVDAQADGNTPLTNVLDEFRAAVPGRHAIVAITPDASGDWLGSLIGLTGGGAAALAMMIAAPDANLAAIIARLDQAALRHSTFRPGDHLPLITPLRQKDTGYRISPLGRAVRVTT